jgi:signal transduction histidine kinase
MAMVKLLLVDDEPELLGMMRDRLVREGYEVECACNGMEGMQKAAAVHPMLIVCDVNMPRMDGYDLLQALQKDPATSDIPFIFLTSLTDTRDLRRGMSLGADDYLFKPVNLDDLLSAVKARLTRSDQREQSVGKKVEEKIQAVRTEIAENLSHELRTPLNGIVPVAELLEMYQKEGSPIPADLMDILRKSTDRLSRTVERFLLFSELEATRKSPPQPRDLETIQNPDDEVKRLALQVAFERERDKDLRLELSRAPIRIERRFLQHMVVQLVENGFKFSPNGTPVTVRLTFSGNTMEFSVRDFGCGMTPEQVQNIQAFKQFDRARYEQQGSGLGLAVVRLITERYGGKWKIVSKRSQGVTINITMPVCTAD